MGRLRAGVCAVVWPAERHFSSLFLSGLLRPLGSESGTMVLFLLASWAVLLETGQWAMLSLVSLNRYVHHRHTRYTTNNSSKKQHVYNVY